MPRSGCGRWRSGATSRPAACPSSSAKSTLDQDRFIRTLGWRQAAQRDLEALSGPARAAVDAYTDGVNAYIDSHGQGNQGLAFVVTAIQSGTGGVGGYLVEPWTALDSVAWQKVQGWQLGGNFETEVFRMLADARLGDPALTDALFPAYRADMPVITPTRRGHDRRVHPRTPRQAHAGPTPPSSPPPRPPRGGTSPRSTTGSCAWPGSTVGKGSRATTRSVRTTGSWRHRRARAAARSWPTTPTSGSRCPRSGS